MDIYFTVFIPVNVPQGLSPHLKCKAPAKFDKGRTAANLDKIVF